MKIEERMKTKNIFKALALAILMPALLLNTSCNSEIINNENTDGKGFALPVTVNVTRQGDDPATKATYNESTRKLEFSAGDKLLVRGNDNSGGGAGYFAGMLDYDASEGKFSGTIYTQNEYSGTADELFTAATANWVGAVLFPNDYESYEFLSLSGSGYSTSYSMSYNKAIAATKAAAVVQFSLETAKTYSSGFALSPENAILNFTITGLTDGAKDVVLKNGESNMFSGSVTPTSGTAAFALGARIKDNSDWPVNLKNVILTIGGTDIDITSTNNNLAAGKIYNINRAVPVVTNLSTINADYTVNDGETLTGTLGKTVKISIADGATVTLSGVDINTNATLSAGNYPGITCLGTATIILKDGTTNSVWALNYGYPGIYVPQGKTLTIKGETLGTGILNATGRGSVAGAGIGAASESKDIYRSCGNIFIAGGVINATAGSERAAGIGCGGSQNPGSSNPSTCGTITITGGTITATGGKWAPGIGGGFDGDCGDITIANTVTSVTATKGAESYSSLFDCIGRGRDGACGTVKFGNQTMYNGSSWTTTPTSGSTYGGLSLTISQTTYANDTWTLTPVLP